MPLRDDERAQTVQVGAILLLGTLVIALSIYQVTSVPGQNGDTEFTHNQGVHEQLQYVRNAILDAAATGRSRSATVRLGTQYRDRIVAINPPPPSGTLRTEPLPAGSAIQVTNAKTVPSSGTDEATGCWDGTARTVPTKGLVYQPEYNEYHNAPRTIYENSVLYDRFANERENGDDVFVNVSGQRLVSGTRVSFVALGGSYSASQSGTVSIDARPASPESRTISLTDSADGPITLSVATSLDNGTWKKLLRDEFVDANNPNSGHVTNMRVENGSLSIELERGVNYDLSLSQVTLGAGSNIDTEGLRCLTGPTDVSADNGNISEGETKRLVFEVYDQYNAPVSNEKVSLAIDGPGNLSDTSVRTDDEGRVTVTYTAPPNIDDPDAPVTVRATSDDSVDLSAPGFDRNGFENAAYDLTVENTDNSLAAIRWDRTAIGDQPGMTCDDDGCTYDPAADDDAFEAFAAVEPPTDTTVNFESSDDRVAEFESDSATTNPGGRATVTVNREDSGTTILRVSGGANSPDERDELPITILNRKPTATFDFAPATPRTRQRVDFDARASSDPDPEDRDALSYEWDFGDGTTSLGQTTNHEYADDGTYDVTLVVDDGNGGRTSTTETIRVSNRAPTAAIEYGPNAPLTGQTVVFDAAGSEDPDGEISRYEWDLDGDGTFETTGERVERSYDDDGDREVMLRVTDDDGATATATRTVAVQNRPPTANFYYTPQNPQEGDRIQLIASGSSDPDGEISSYEWTFVDQNGQNYSFQEETLDFNSVLPGQYDAFLRVTDDDGDSDVERDALVVSSPLDVSITGVEQKGKHCGDGEKGEKDDCEYEATTELSAPNGNLDRVVYELRDADTGGLLDSKEDDEIYGSSGTSTGKLKAEHGSGRYRIVVTVYDEQGRTDSDETTISAG